MFYYLRSLISKAWIVKEIVLLTNFLKKGGIKVISISKNETRWSLSRLLTKSSVISSNTAESLCKVPKSERAGLIGEQAHTIFATSLPNVARLLPLCGVPITFLRRKKEYGRVRPYQGTVSRTPHVEPSLVLPGSQLRGPKPFYFSSPSHHERSRTRLTFFATMPPRL